MTSLHRTRACYGVMVPS